MNIASRLADEFGIQIKTADNIIRLLDEGNTIPFISRYRKEATGSMDDERLFNLSQRIIQLRELEKRREFVYDAISSAGRMTQILSQALEEAVSLTQIEDIYLPFKPKRRTRATIAKELGLEPLAKIIMSGSAKSLKQTAVRFIRNDVKSAEDALAGARDIIAEWVSEHQLTRQIVRDYYTRTARITVKIENQHPESKQFESLDGCSFSISRIPSHRLFAILRGKNAGALKYKIETNSEEIIARISGRWSKEKFDSETRAFVSSAVKDSFNRLIKPSIENDVLTDARERADKDAVGVFSANLRQLLLTPPLGAKRILAIDPGYRMGCKVACITETGVPVAHDVIYPTPPLNDTTGATAKLKELTKRHCITDISVGNGTASSETVSFLRNISWEGSTPTIHVVNEAGASVYSASDIARKELPDLDPLARGAISIARRLQDPLAELVKIDPKSIGVGQYQHDVDQTLLKSSLDMTVESCVNEVGVDINSASECLLEYVAGIGPQLARNIVEYRTANGPFRNRQEILRVPKLGPKTFTQAAGFLRINNGDNPLDALGIHPESYTIVGAMARDLNVNVADLPGNSMALDKIDPSNYTTTKVGLPTVKDIIHALSTPGRDPRGETRQATYDNNVSDISQLRAGMTLTGVINNVTDFGAFVDLGVHCNGLLHISKIRNSGRKVGLGQTIDVVIIDVDIDRKRISLNFN